MRTMPICSLLLTLLALAGCATSKTMAQPPQPSARSHATARPDEKVSTSTPQAPPSSNLTAALRFAPAEATTILFTDWALARHDAHMDSLTSDSPDTDKEAFYNQVHISWTTFGHSLGKYIGESTAPWGFSIFDIQWSANIDMPPSGSDDTKADRSMVIQLIPTADIAMIETSIILNGYAKTQNTHADIFTASPQVWEQLWPQEDPSHMYFDKTMLAIAILPDQHMVITAPSEQALSRMVNSYTHPESSLGHKPEIQRTAEQLGIVATALVQTGKGLSEEYQGSQMIGKMHKADQQRFKAALETPMATLHSYQALGFGYRMEGAQPTAIATLAYADAATARSDREARLRLATEGYTLKKHYNYHRTSFTVAPQASEQASITLVLTSKDHTAESFYNMVAAHDFLFAACN